MTTISKQAPEQGYSNDAEVDYVLTEDSVISLFTMFENDLFERLCELRQQFATYCKERAYNAGTPSAYHQFVHYMLEKADFKIRRRYANTMMIYYDALSRVNDQFTSADPLIKFVTVSEQAVYQPMDVLESSQAQAARKAQGKVKDNIVLALDPSLPVVDIGGGIDASLRSADSKGIILSSYTSIDLRAPKPVDMNSVDYDAFDEQTQFVANHSLYYMKPSKLATILSRDLRGTIFVVDPSPGSFTRSGEGYALQFEPMSVVGVEAFRVSGSIYQDQTGAGRDVKNEYWYSRNQWVKWGYELTPLFSSPIQLLKEFYVSFCRRKTRPYRYPCIMPDPIILTTALHVNEEVRVDFPGLFSLVDNYVHAQKFMHGFPVYQTPKLDGISMLLRVRPNGELALMDRKRQTFSVTSLANSKVYALGLVGLVAQVELLVQPGTRSTFRMFLTQLLHVPQTWQLADGLEEITRAVIGVNDACHIRALGRKDYYFVPPGKVCDFDSCLPHDGVIYIPSNVTCARYNSPFFGYSHMFFKPYQTTDTNQHVIGDYVKTLERSGTGVKVFYRIASSTVSGTSPYSKEVVDLMRRYHNNTGPTQGATTLTPLLYEIIHFPKGHFDEDDESIVVSHVRGDKPYHASRMSVTESMPFHKTGRFLCTQYGPPGELVSTFLARLSASRLMKFIPEQVGVSSSFMTEFFDNWKSGEHELEYQELNKSVAAGIYTATLDVFLKALRHAVPYAVSNYVIDALMRIPMVNRQYTLNRKRVEVVISFSLDLNFKDVVPLKVAGDVFEPDANELAEKVDPVLAFD